MFVLISKSVVEDLRKLSSVETRRYRLFAKADQEIPDLRVIPIFGLVVSPIMDDLCLFANQARPWLVRRISHCHHVIDYQFVWYPE